MRSRQVKMFDLGLRIVTVCAWLAVSLIVFGSGCAESSNSRDCKGRIVIEYWHQPMVKRVPGLEQVTAEVGDFERYLADQIYDPAS